MHVFARATPRILTTFFGLFFVLFVTLILPRMSFAQWDVPTARPLELTVSPAFPGPHTQVNVSVNAYSTDTSGARITWYKDGVELPREKDLRSIIIETGNVGEVINLSARVEPAHSGAFTLRKTITPATVDIVVEADTYVPAFYRGRALPSVESRVRVIAIPHLGKNLDPRTLTYKWEHNGSVLFGGANRGMQSVTMTVPRYMSGGARVTISDSAGVLLAQSDIPLDASPTELLFYEENPLRGLSELAFQGNLALIGEETTVHGEPYFLNIRDGFSNMAFDWEVNGTKTENGNADPHTITLRRTGGSGTANISLSAYTTNTLPQPINGSFMINF